MKTAVIKRQYQNDRVISKFILYDENKNLILQTFYSLELPWKENKHNISCIPEGIYSVEPNNTTAHPHTYRVLNVPDRSGILIHIANYISDLRGCIGLGMSLNDIDKDGKLDISSSTKAVKKLYDLIGEENFKLIIL